MINRTKQAGQNGFKMMLIISPYTEISQLWFSYHNSQTTNHLFNYFCHIDLAYPSLQ